MMMTDINFANTKKRYEMKKTLLSALLLALCMTGATASNTAGVSPLIQNIPGRDTKLLDGHWKYILDMKMLNKHAVIV